MPVPISRPGGAIFSLYFVRNKTGTSHREMLYVDNQGSTGLTDRRAYRVARKVVPWQHGRSG